MNNTSQMITEQIWSLMGDEILKHEFGTKYVHHNLNFTALKRVHFVKLWWEFTKYILLEEWKIKIYR